LIGLLQDILCILQTAANGVLWALVTFLNSGIGAIAAATGAALLLLPDMPAQPDPLDSRVLDYINWFYPVGGLVGILTIAVTLWITWRVVRIPLRWGKVT
jgi:hypothetical protein